ncbi:hypothetical protein [Vannielia litorea]|uniref:hypothetical protein n=1 Tax=Vannielia litorea TaxID=1217970 RepID=UPI001C955EFF|nr:hypothetical protein [Vannielia litorea]MBY6049810.1 hypothetical protein [Vannielia litorea]MBY6077224.1 hypothetical protein [Vannielia litorea]
MTDHEKSLVWQFVIASNVGAGAFLFGPEQARYSIVPLCCAWLGAISFWAMTADTYGEAKKTSALTAGDYLAPFISAWISFVFGVFAAAPVLISAVVWMLLQ